MLVRWTNTRDAHKKPMTIYWLNRPADPVGMPFLYQTTLDYTKRFSWRVWWKHQRAILLNKIITKLEQMK